MRPTKFLRVTSLAILFTATFGLTNSTIWGAPNSKPRARKIHAKTTPAAKGSKFKPDRKSVV